MLGKRLCSLSYSLRRWINGWSALALALLGGYGCVIYLATHPNITAAYRAYYIDRTSEISPVMLELLGDPLAVRAVLPVLTVGQLYAHDAPELLLVGWSTTEPAHTWTLGRQAQIMLVLPASQTSQARDFTLTLRGIYLAGAQRIIAQIDYGGTRGNPIDRTYHDGEDIVMMFRLPSRAEPVVTLALELPDAKLPGNGDPRVLGFALQSVQVTQTGI